MQIYNSKMHAARLTTINLHALQLTSALQAAARIHSYCLQQVLTISQARSPCLTGCLNIIIQLTAECYTDAAGLLVCVVLMYIVTLI